MHYNNHNVVRIIIFPMAINVCRFWHFICVAPTGGKIFVFCVSFQKMNDKMTAAYLLYYMLYIFFMKQYF